MGPALKPYSLHVPERLETAAVEKPYRRRCRAIPADHPVAELHVFAPYVAPAHATIASARAVGSSHIGM